MRVERKEKSSRLMPPCGGSLVNLVVGDKEASELRMEARHLPALQLSERAVCDLELLATGAFSPLDRFMGESDYQRVLREMRLESGHVFPIPITLPSSAADASLREGRDVALCDARREVLAVMTIEERYKWKPDVEAAQVYATRDLRHPLVAEMQGWGRLNLSGRLRVLGLPRHYDFPDLRLTPQQTRPAGNDWPRKRRGVSDTKPLAPRPRGTDAARDTEH